MVKKIRRRFIALSMLALFLLMSVVVVGMNTINYHAVVTNADEMLGMLSRNEGRFPDMEKEPKPFKKPRRMTEETPFETRFFSVVLTEDGDCVNTDTSRIALVDSNTAKVLAQKVQKSRRDSGFVQTYRYTVTQQDADCRITFLDCRRDLDAFRTFLLASLSMAAAGYVVVSLLLIVLSGRIVKPIAESYEKQKRFITDAGHEMKTPLTIIHANLDLLESDYGEDESIADIRTQTKRLSNLTQKMVRLAKMEEADDTLVKVDFPLSDMVQETVTEFKTVAQDKPIHTDVTPMLSMHGDGDSIRELVNILLDNAVKYTPDGGWIRVGLHREGRHLCLRVENTTENALTQEDTERIFDRFYRADASRNSETGGHGIGLSMAQAIVHAHGGSIRGRMVEKDVFEITVSLPS